MNRSTLGLVLAACALASVACQPNIEEGSVTVSGHVLAGPTCPVVRVPPDPDCDDRPVPGAVIVVIGTGGEEVARTETDAAGAFSFSLPPGEYELAPQPVEGLLGTAAPVRIAVVDGADPEPVTFAYDTGIR